MCIRDRYIEERFHKTVGELFIERGETGFRELERNMLHEVAELSLIHIFLERLTGRTIQGYRQPRMFPVSDTELERMGYVYNLSLIHI